MGHKQREEVRRCGPCGYCGGPGTDGGAPDAGKADVKPADTSPPDKAPPPDVPPADKAVPDLPSPDANTLCGNGTLDPIEICDGKLLGEPRVAHGSGVFLVIWTDSRNGGCDTVGPLVDPTPGATKQVIPQTIKVADSTVCEVSVRLVHAGRQDRPCEQTSGKEAGQNKLVNTEAAEAPRWQGARRAHSGAM